MQNLPECYALSLRADIRRISHLETDPNERTLDFILSYYFVFRNMISAVGSSLETNKSNA